jgi:hypothetical protein
VWHDEPKIWKLPTIGEDRFTWSDRVFEPGFLVVQGIHPVGSLVIAASPRVIQATACGISELRLELHINSYKYHPLLDIVGKEARHSSAHSS